MVDFNQSIAAHQASDAFVAETGGLPEISRASFDLRTAIEQTRTEVLEATFAPSRFPTTTSDFFNSMVDGVHLSPRAKQAVAVEGEAGYKRSELEHDLLAIQAGLQSLISQLVDLRCNLKVSQTE